MMKVSYKWLGEYVDLSGVTPQQLADKLTRGGVEVDAVEPLDKGVEQVVVGRVLECERHPDADKLNVCKVDTGTGETLQIVCGAKNVAAGQHVPVALVGASLPGGVRIKRTKLRGVESQGMICSGQELGLNVKLLPKDQQDGILVLSDQTVVGTDIKEVLGLDDTVLELDLTPNRADCLSMIGVAYEVAALLDRPVRLPEAADAERPGAAPAAADAERPGAAPAGTEAQPGAAPAAQSVTVRIDAPEHCYRYAARLISGVAIQPSPGWMQQRLTAAGVRPINNVVDITNYVMLEYGQPLHAFDMERVDGAVVVRLARDGETIVTLDGQERVLDPDMLLIADENKAIGIAGVMGGANSEVTGETRYILLESARFAGSSIRKTARKLGLRSEASTRFEKEANPSAVIPALNRAAQLMEQLGEGKAAKGIVDEVKQTEDPRQVTLRLDRVNQMLGMDLSLEEVESVVRRLSFDYTLDREKGRLDVTVPRRRNDITREIDLVEEVARLYGYDNIPTTLMVGETTPGSFTLEQRVRRSLRHMLSSIGMFETLTYSLSNPSYRDEYPGLYPGVRPIALAMPMSEERSELRTSIIPHLIEAAEYNRNRKNEQVSIFEIGKVFLTDHTVLADLPEERWLISGLVTGSRNEVHWSGKTVTVDFYDVKGIVEKIAEFLGVDGLEFRSGDAKGLHPGRTADLYLGGHRLGRMGQLHPDVQSAHDLEDTYVFEMELVPLVAAMGGQINYVPLPRYPAITRDVAIVIAKNIPVAEVQKVIAGSAGKLLESLMVFDVYTGERLGLDKKSVAFSLVFRHRDRTLTDEEVSTMHEQIVSELEQKFNAELRK